MLDNPHECGGGCGRTIQGAHNYCLFCRSTMRRDNRCQFCGYHLSGTIYPAAHIKACKAALVVRSDELAIPHGEMLPTKRRGQGMTENIYDTKRGG